MNKALSRTDFDRDYPEYQFVKNILRKNDFNSNWMLRRNYLANYGFAIITLEEVQLLTKILKGKKVLDAGCGSGYITHFLQAQGVDIVGIDSEISTYCFGDSNTPKRFFKKWTDYIVGDVIDHLDNNHYDVVIMSWPDMDLPISEQVARKLPINSTLLYLGEGNGGCTGTDEFHDVIYNDWVTIDHLTDELNDVHARFDGIYDTWGVYRKWKNSNPQKVISE